MFAPLSITWMIPSTTILPISPSAARLPSVKAIHKQCLRKRYRLPALPDVPWEFGFQCNERYLKWDRSAQSQLVKLVVMDRLQLNEEQMKSRLVELTAVLPGMDDRLDTMKASLLVDMMRDMDMTADKVLAIKTALPSFDVASAVQRWPEFIACHSEEELLSDIDRWLDACHGDTQLVCHLLNKEPRCLKIQLEEALKEVERLMPGCPNAFDRFINDPGQFLSMEQMGLESSN